MLDVSRRHLVPDPPGDVVGTVRRDPVGFAHAIRIAQPDEYVWHVVDYRGPVGEALRDEDVADWPVVYTPVLQVSRP